ncbi:hypothetical protein N9X62_00635 [Candidatus Poseidoniales archaeon]|nr:hypothetical protein [Candidatus Poseidoniales archaeon]
MMEQKAPRLSTASLVAGSICVTFAVLNASANLVLESGLSIEEYSALAAAGLCFVTSYLASRERPIPELINQPSIQEQYDAMESTPTPYRASGSVPTQQPAHNLSASPSSDLSSILGMEQTVAAPTAQPVLQPYAAPEPIDVSAALDSLSTGEFGAVAAEMASENPAPHTATSQNRPFTQSVGSLASSHERPSIANVPLPTASLTAMEPQPEATTASVPSMPDLGDLLGSTSEPVVELTTPAIPDIPNLDDAPSQPASQMNTLPTLPEVPGVGLQTPDLPDIGDLF